MDDDHDDKKESPLNCYLLDDSTLKRPYAAFFAFLGEWLILIVTCSIALFFIPLTPSFTLHSTSTSVLHVTAQNHFTANLGVEFLVDHSNPMGSNIYYDSLHLSLFQHQQTLSTFSLPNQPTKFTTIQTMFPNVTVTLDQWRVDHGAAQVHGTSCGFAYLDLWFSVNATYTQPLWPTVRDKLQGHCGEVKFELCSSGETTFVSSFLASCDVYSAVVHKIRLVLFAMLILLLVTAAAVPLIVDRFFCTPES